MDTTTSIILAVLSGGSVAALINAISSRRKNNAEAENTNVDASLKLRDKAISSLLTTEEKLDECQKLLDEARIELLVYKSYVITLGDILDKHGIKYKTFEEYKNKKIKEVL